MPTDVTQSVDNLVIGAGVTGLATAYFLRESECLVLEGFSEVGGACQSIRMGPFCWDYGGHFLHFRNNRIRELIQLLVGDRLIEVSKRASVYVDDTLLPYPLQAHVDKLVNHIGSPRIHDFPKYKSIRNLEEALINAYGQLLYYSFFQNYITKQYCCNPRQLAPNALGRFLPSVAPASHMKEDVDKPHSYNDVFYALVGGVDQLPKALLRAVGFHRVSMGEPALNIDINARVVRTKHRLIQYRRLISTIPLPSLLRIAGQSEFAKGMCANKVVVLNMGFDGPSTLPYHWIYIPSSDIPFYRVGSYDRVFSEDNMSLYVEFSLPSSSDISCNDATMLALPALKEIGIVTTQRLTHRHSVIVDPAYVQITNSEICRVPEVIKWLKKHGVVSIGRYGSWTYNSIEDGIVSAWKTVGNGGIQ